MDKMNIIDFLEFLLSGWEFWVGVFVGVCGYRIFCFLLEFKSKNKERI